MDDTRLIVEVEKYNILYDPQNMLYKDLNTEEKAWEAIGVDGQTMDRAADDFMERLRKKVSGLKEASSLEKCEVMLFFCPIVSRAGTDIDAAINDLDQVKASKPVIMVILHHTHDPEKFLPDSNNAIKRANTTAVDCVFYEDKLLKCQKNDDAIDTTSEYLKSMNLISYYCLKKDPGNRNLSTDQKAENDPSIVPRPQPNSRQEDRSCSICCCCSRCWSRCCASVRELLCCC